MRKAGAEDAYEVIALWGRCGLTRPWNDPHADFARAIAGPSSAVLLLREGDALVASVMVGDDGHRGWVYYLAVAPERRRAGLGRMMMDAAEAWLRERGAAKLQLMVREDNEAALGFYEALGLERQKVVTLDDSAMITLYGIRNCDTVRKARAWLDARALAYAFHDYKLAGIDAARLAPGPRSTGWENLINRAGTTFRKLADAHKAELDENKAIALMLAQPSMIRRPVLDLGARRLVGFRAEEWGAALGGGR